MLTNERTLTDGTERNGTLARSLARGSHAFTQKTRGLPKSSSFASSFCCAIFRAYAYVYVHLGNEENLFVNEGLACRKSQFIGINKIIFSFFLTRVFLLSLAYRLPFNSSIKNRISTSIFLHSKPIMWNKRIAKVQISETNGPHEREKAGHLSFKKRKRLIDGTRLVLKYEIL